MKVNTLQHTLPYAVVFLLFCIPLGPTLKSIGLVAALISVLLIPQYRQDFGFIFSRPIGIAAISVCGVVILACAWSIGSVAQQVSMIEKYSKLLYLPLLAVGFQHKKLRYLGINAFLIGMLIACIASFYKYAYVIPLPNELPDPGKVFYNHIVSGFMMALAAYLAAFLCTKTQAVWSILYGCAALLFSIQVMFVNTGRTGYVLYAILVALFFAQHFSLKPVRYAIGIGLLSLAIAIHFGNHETLSQRVHLVLENLQDYKQGQQSSSVGFRLQFHRYAKRLFLEKPLYGQGTGSFTPRYFMDNPIPAWDFPLPDPHSQYWLIASEFGLLGLTALSYLFISLFRMSLCLRDMKPVLQAVLLVFMTGCYSDGLLTNSGVGYLFITLSALCGGELVELHRKKIAPPPMAEELVLS